MPKPSDETKARKLEVVNGDGYLFRAIDFGCKGVKIELYDPRELDLLDRDRLHAVILTPQKIRELFLWIGKL
jgi:hypothetical protein